MRTQVRTQEWSPTREILPLILGQAPDEDLSRQDARKLELFEKGLKNEISPNDTIEMAVTNRNEDLTKGAADIAVRMVRPTQAGLVSRRIGTTRIGLYAHREYCRRFGEPRSLEDLRGHRLIGFDRDNFAFRAVGGLADGLSRDDFVFRCDSDVVQLAALRAGVGVGGCQDGIAARTKDLVPILPDAFHVSLEIWLTMRGDLKSDRRVRLLYDRLAKGLTD